MLHILLYVTLAGATKESWTNSSRVTSGDLATITTAPTSSRSPLDHLNAIDRACAASWLAWSKIQSSNSFYMGSNRTLLAETAWPMTRTSEVRVVKIPLVSTSAWTKCDGIRRLAYNTTAFTTSITTSYYDRFLTEPPREFEKYPFPQCNLSGGACYDAWLYVANMTGDILNRNADFGALLGFDKKLHSGYDGRDFFGCKPPQDLCTKAFGKCAFGAARFFLIYFPPKVLSRDLCARNGFGSYVLANETLTPGEPMSTAVLDNLPFETTELEGAQLEAARKAMTGPFTFTSGTVYVGYQGMYASHRCMHTSEYQYRYGVTPVPLSQISTMYYPRWDWDDSWLHYAQSMAAGKFSDTRGYSEVSTALDLVDLEEPMPAAKYFLHQHDCGNTKGNCTAIVQGDYHPYVSVPNVFTGLGPAFAGCTQSFPMWDPPLQLTPTRAAARPTAPSWATAQVSDVAGNAGSPIAGTAAAATMQAAPGETVATVPRPTGLAGNPTVTAAATIRRTGQTGQSGQSEEASEQDLPEWGGSAIAPDATKVIATPVAANPGVIAIGPNLFVAGGPGYLSQGQKLSLGAFGLVIGTRTLNIEYASQYAGDKSGLPYAGGAGGRLSGLVQNAAAARATLSPPGDINLGSMAVDDSDDSSATTSTSQASVSGVVRVATTTSKKSGAVRHVQAPRWLSIIRALTTRSREIIRRQ